MAALAEEIHQSFPESTPKAFTSTRFWHRKLTLTGHAKSDTPVPKMIFYMLIDVGSYMLTIITGYYLLTRFLILPVERGFYCNDASIRQPYIPNTISTTLLLIITLFIPYFIIFGDIWIRKDLFSGGRSFIVSLLNPSFQTCRSTCYVYLDYVLSFGILTYSLEIIKCFTGRLRPNFIQLCNPSTLHECENNLIGYITTFECQTSFKNSRNSKLSFPSGHAAASVFILLFLWYFLKRTERQLWSSTIRDKNRSHSSKNKMSPPIKTNDNTKHDGRLALKAKLSSLYCHTVIALYSGFCIICSASRIFDNWHFTSDVIGGALIALLLFFILLKPYTNVPKPIHQKFD